MALKSWFSTLEGGTHPPVKVTTSVERKPKHRFRRYFLAIRTNLSGGARLEGSLELAIKPVQGLVATSDITQTSFVSPILGISPIPGLGGFQSSELSNRQAKFICHLLLSRQSTRNKIDVYRTSKWRRRQRCIQKHGLAPAGGLILRQNKTAKLLNLR